MLQEEVDSRGRKPWRGFRRDGIALSAIATDHGQGTSLAWRVDVGEVGITFTGDTGNRRQTVKTLAEGSTIIVGHHAVPENVRGFARDEHMPPSQLAKLAEEADATMLILSHRTPRTRGRELQSRREIGTLFKGAVLFANDLECWNPKVSAGPEALLALWFGQAPASPPPPEVRERWFRASEAEDARLQCTFLPALEAAGAGGGWPRRNARERLARVILLDQLPRHCFRGTARAFAFDALARTEAKAALAQGDEAHHAPAQTLFLTMPFRHSEALATVCALRQRYRAWMRRWGDHAQAPLILDFDRSAASLERRLRRFGRDPWRNAALGRLDGGGARLSPQGEKRAGNA